MAVKKIKLTSQTAWETQKDLNDNFSELEDRIDGIPVVEKTSDITNDGDGTSPFATQDYVAQNGGKIDSISVNGTPQTIDANKNVDITVPVDADDVGALPDTTKYGASILMTINSSTYVVTVQLKDQDGNNLGTAQTIDLPLESVVVSGSYDSATREVVLTLEGGSTIRFSVADLVSGLQSEITSTNKLDADLVDDSTSANKFVTAQNKSDWNAKYLKPAGGIPASDLAESYYLASNPNGYTKVESSSTNGNIKIDNVETTVYTLPNDVARISDIPDELSDLSGDSTHRLVTDTEKATWDAKQDVIANLTFTDDDSRWSSVDANGFYTLTITSGYTPERVYKNGSNGLKQEVLATANYDGTYIYVVTDTKFSGSVSVK